LIKYPSHNATADYIGFINEFLKDMEEILWVVYKIRCKS
jgi:hypothetical protein